MLSFQMGRLASIAVTAIWIVVVAGVAALSGPSESVIVGPARVIDGDTLVIGGRRIRLSGIDAPEIAQSCLDGDGLPYECGKAAAAALAQFMGAARPARCRPESRDRWGRLIASCRRDDGADAATFLVRSGNARNWQRYSKGRYADVEAAARRSRRGLWRGAFVEPWLWRRTRIRPVPGTGMAHAAFLPATGTPQPGDP